MCRLLTVRATLATGEPHPDIPDAVDLEMPDKWDTEYPTCTCWIGDTDKEGTTLRHTFADKVLAPFLKKVAWGNIIIEVR